MTPLFAVVAAVAAALILGISSVADQRSTKRVESRRALSPRILLDLVRQPLWVTAVAANIAGFALQVVALSFGSLALVQTIVVCDLIFAVLILWYLRRRSDIQRPGGRRKAPIVFAGVAATTAGAGRIPRHRTAVGRPYAGRLQHVSSTGHSARCGGGRLPGSGGPEPELAAARAELNQRPGPMTFSYRSCSTYVNSPEADIARGASASQSLSVI